MKNRYLFNSLGFIFILGLLFSSMKVQAQNRNYLDFDGSDDYVKYTDDATLENLNGASNYTLEAWVYVSSSCASGAQILHRTNQFYLYYYSTGSYPDALDFKVYDGSAYQLYYTKKSTLTTDTWHHIAVVRNTALTYYLHIYIDGVDQISADKNAYALASSNTKNLYVGNDGNGGNYFTGYIDEVRLKNVAVDPANLQIHTYDNQYASDANTAALFHFNEGSTQYTVNEASSANARLGSTTSGDAAEPVWTNWDANSHLSLAYEWTGGTDTDWGTTTNWGSSTVPDFSKDVIIPTGLTNYPSINGDATTPSQCNNLLIESSAVLTIPAGKALTVNGTLTNNGGNAGLVVESNSSSTDGSLMESSGVQATVKRYVAAAADATHGWHFISSPVDGQDISTEFVDVTASPISTNVDFYRWSESENLWINIKNSSGDYNQGSATTNFSNDASPQFANGKGYLIAYSADQTKNFTGTTNVSDVSWSGLTMSNDGWHLLGNPFASALLWDNTSADWSLSNINSNAKIWDEVNASYTDIPAGSVIPPMQGFMVQVTDAAGGSLTIPASDRSHGGNAWYKEDNVNKITLTVYDTEGSTAQKSIVKANTQATTGFDTQFDSHFLAGYAPQFYSVLGDDHYSTNTLPEITSLTTIPFEFIKNASSSYYIEAEGITNLVPTQEVYLIDLKTNYSQKLNDNSVYYFTAEEGDPIQRFELHFGPLGINNISKVNPFNVYCHNDNIEIKTGNTVDAVVNVYNVSGQLIVADDMDHQSEVSLNVNGFKGVAIVSIITDNEVYNQKVVIK